MWEARRQPLEYGQKVSILFGGTALSFADALEALRCDEGFRAFLLTQLRGAPFPAFFWETPPVTQATIAGPFEYVIIAAPGLGGATADPRPFARQFAGAGSSETVISFENLGGDAVLIVPRCLGASDAYAHLAVFLRSAPMAQQHELLAVTASRSLKALTDRPLWISTCGLGVFWLHVRLDNRPKYYSHAPFRRWPDSLDRAPSPEQGR
jgi:hypothetical protein